MSLELVKEAVKVNRSVGSGAAQTVVDNDIIVPDVKPDIAKILSMDGYAVVNSAQVNDGDVIIQGKVNYKILYICEDDEQCIKGIDTSSEFSYVMSVIDAENGMSSKVKCDVEHIQYEILNGRKINAKTVLKIEARVIERVEQNIASDLTGAEGIQVLRKSSNINCYIGETEEKCSISEILEVPAGKAAIKEILRNDVKVINKSFETIDNKVIAKGELSISSLYVGDDEYESIQYMEHEIPFTQVMSFPGVSESSFCEMEYKVIDYQFEAEEDGDGELRGLRAEVAVTFFAEGYEEKKIEAIADAYSPDMRLDVGQESFSVEEFIKDSKSQISLSDTIDISDDNPDVQEIFNVMCKASISEYKVQNGKLVIEGVTQNSVLYLAENVEQPVLCISKEIPFKEEIEFPELKENMNCEVEVDVEHCNFSMISCKEVEVRPTLTVSAKISKEVYISMVDSVSEAEHDTREINERPSIVIYFAERGDSLWNLAKRYYTTIDELQEVNDITDDDLTPGRQIIITKRKVQ